MAQKLIKSKSRTKAKFDPSHDLSSIVKAAEESVVSKHKINFRAGDTVKVNVKIKEGEKHRIQAFEGVCIRIGGHGVGKTFSVRKISHGVGVERIFLFTSPIVASVDVMQRGKVRRAKLYYLRDLSGRAAKIENRVHTQESIAAKAAAAAAKA